MDAAAATSWRLLSPAAASPPPCPPQLLKRRATFAAWTSGQSASSRSSKHYRLLCLLHDKPAPTTSSAQSTQLQRLATALQCGAVWAAVQAPAALAVTGEEDLDILGILPPVAVIAFFYFIVAPVPLSNNTVVCVRVCVQPVIMNWMRLRWYKREFVETYLQFMFTYIFFPALMVWAPFVNFRKFPRDPTMKYPWSKPKEGTPLFKDRYPPIDS
ncbi:hypothetical protein U9M48_014373 [Paspalum notatum var. saurae]|uniref:Uncharacterized protein n=1 Tax=Paspalum notatum var. saurae TaxID=547442 RepID=A0AAQ3WKP6_PASNO